MDVVSNDGGVVDGGPAKRHVEWLISDLTDEDLFAIVEARFMSVPQAMEKYGDVVRQVVCKVGDDRLTRFTVGIPGIVGKDGKMRGGNVTLVSARQLKNFKLKRRPNTTVEERIAALRAKLAELERA